MLLAISKYVQIVVEVIISVIFVLEKAIVIVAMANVENIIR